MPASRTLHRSTRDADRWFREQGLPTFVPLRRWFTDLPRRVAPLIAALPFVFSAVSEARYRERFFDPIMADMHRAILVRDELGRRGAR